tara:strand:+ start:202 stop:336 length:135 start_codon:yes stop_codon:yes gene_type:complete
MDKDFLNKYLLEFSELMRPDDLILDQLVEKNRLSLMQMQKEIKV